MLTGNIVQTQPDCSGPSVGYVRRQALLHEFVRLLDRLIQFTGAPHHRKNSLHFASHGRDYCIGLLAHCWPTDDR